MYTKDIRKLADELVENVYSIKTAEASESEQTETKKEATPIKVELAEELRKVAQELRQAKPAELNYSDVFAYIKRFSNG